jgi:hypothetical protein
MASKQAGTCRQAWTGRRVRGWRPAQKSETSTLKAWCKGAHGVGGNMAEPETKQKHIVLLLKQTREHP